MHTPQEFIQHIRRRWWWSEEPYWKYLQDGRGWANAVDTHPGIFNLIWLHSGVRGVPQSFVPYAASAAWAMDNGLKIKCVGVTLADMAFKLDLVTFVQALNACEVRWPVKQGEKL